jgi:ERCC4-related helicase
MVVFTIIQRQMEYSLGMFFTVLKDINGSETAAGKNKTNKKTSRSIKENRVWKEMYQNTQAMINNGEAHPKFAMVSELVSEIGASYLLSGDVILADAGD